MTSGSSGGRVLVVDDSAVNIDLLRDIFLDAGYEVVSAEDGLEALRLVEENQPDVVLLDLVMPGIDGREVLARLRQSEATREIPVIFISGIGESVEKARLLREGADDYVTKPFLGAEVLARVSHHLELKRAREEAERREALQRVAGELARVGGWEFDAAEDRWSWTEEVERIHECSGEEGLPICAHLFRGDSRNRLDAAIEEALTVGQPYDLVLDFVSPSGVEKWVHTICRPVVRDGAVVKLFGAVQEITERVRADTDRKVLVAELHQAQKMEALGTLAGGIAHDFNNILGAIIGYSQLSLAQVPEHAEIYENLNETLSAARRARDLVKQILAFSRRSMERPSPIEVAPILKETVKLLRSTMPATIEISMEEPDPESFCVLATPTQIHQIVMNLGTNAFQALSSKGGRIVFSLGAVRLDRAWGQRLGVAPEEYVCVGVRDDGPGIRAELLDKIFDPFFTTKPVGEGTGLGLSVVLGIARANGGAVEVESAPGDGTFFRVYLPRAMGLAATGASANPKVFRKASGRALVVDDEPVLAKLLSKLLMGLGLEVESRSDPARALKLLVEEGERFDVIVTDQTMPGMSGIDLFRRVRGAGITTPVIVCTGHSDYLDPDSATAMGFSAYLKKPVEKEELFESVLEAISKNADGRLG